MITREEEVNEDLDFIPDDEDEIEESADTSEGNDTLEDTVEATVKKVKIGGHEITAKFDDMNNIIEWERPEGMSDEDFRKLQNKVNNYEGALSNAQKDRLEAKRLREQMEKNNALLEKQIANQNQTQQPSTVKTPKQEAFGDLTWAEIDDLKVTDPAAYEKGMDIYHEKLADEKASRGVQMTRAELEESATINEIRATGTDPNAVKVWQKQFQMGNLKAAWLNYQATHEVKPVSPGNRTIQKQAGSPSVVPKDTLSRTEKKYTPEEAHEYLLINHKYPPGYQGSIY